MNLVYSITTQSENRKFPVGNATAYRFGFNGKVDDKETGTQDYGFRIYNSSLGKFLSVDRMSRDFSWWSPYHFAGNSPICAIDLEGLELKVVTHTYKLDGDCKPYLVSTHVGITQNVTIILNGEAHAATDVYVVINGQILYSYTLYEPLNANECFPSARYDYSINENSQKEKEDDEYLNSGPWYSYPFRLAKILARDLLVPDNAPTVNDLSIVQTAAFPFLLPGKILQPEYSVGRYHDGSGHVKGKQIGNKGPALYDGQLRLDNSILFKRDARFSEK